MFINISSHALKKKKKEESILKKFQFVEAFGALSGRTLSGRISSGGVSRTTPSIES